MLPAAAEGWQSNGLGERVLGGARDSWLVDAGEACLGGAESSCALEAAADQ